MTICTWRIVPALLILSNYLLHSNLRFVYEDAPEASDEVENVVHERFYEISGKTCAVKWPGRKQRERIFADTHCVSSIVLGPFAHNTIISIKIY